jgi:hypothetical protein
MSGTGWLRPGVRRVGILGAKQRGGIGILTEDSMQWGMASRWLLAATWTSRASTASHGLTRGPPALGVGPHGSLRSSQAPTRSNCFGRRRIWWPRRLLQVLGFGSVRGKIWAPWPPIYRDFGLITKRILLRSRFAPSIELVTGVGRARSGMTPHAGPAGPWLLRAWTGRPASAGPRWAAPE